MGMLRAYILYNIIKICNFEDKNIKLLFEVFLKLPEIINDQTGGNGNKYFSDNILNWTKEITDDLDYLIFPKFEPMDFLYLFLIINEEKENPKYFKGIAFKNKNNKKLDCILYQLYEQVLKSSNQFS